MVTARSRSTRGRTASIASGLALIPLTALTALIALQCGCQYLVGIDDRAASEDPSDATTDTTDSTTDSPVDGVITEASAETPASCALPTAGDAQLRIGNLMPTTDVVNFCLIPSGVLDASGITPLPGGAGAACQHGLGYRQISTLFGAHSGTYDIRVVSAGSTCNARPIVERAKVFVQEGDALDLFLMGQAPQIATYHEDRDFVALSHKIRLVDAVDGLSPVDFGNASGSPPSATIAAPLITNVSFANAAAASGAGVDPNGYVSAFNAGSPDLFLGARASGTTDVRATLTQKFRDAHRYVVMLTGAVDDPRFPLALTVCDEALPDATRPPLAVCGNGSSVDLTVDTFDAQITGIYAAAIDTRKPAIPSALTSLASDVLCVTNANGAAYRKQIVDAVQGTYPYAYAPTTTVATPPNDPRDATGVVPPAPTAAPCANSLDGLNALVACVGENCITPFTPESVVTSTDVSCVEAKCFDKIFALSTGTPADQECWSCVAAAVLSSSPLSSVNGTCGATVAPPFAFDGDTDTMILSRLPLTETSTWIFPATNWHPSILRAVATAPNGALVDVYCVSTDDARADCSTVPYTGIYANGKTCGDGWLAEEQLQVTQLLAYVKAQSIDRQRPAIIAGELYTGPASTVGSTTVLTAVSPDLFTELQGAFGVAIPADYVPRCTYCFDNPLLEDSSATPGAGTWTSHIFLSGIPVTNVVSAGITLDSPTITWNDGTKPVQIPPSTYYGFRSVVRIEP